MFVVQAVMILLKLIVCKEKIVYLFSNPLGLLEDCLSSSGCSMLGGENEMNHVF